MVCWVWLKPDLNSPVSRLMESLMIKQKSNVWSHSSSGVQTHHLALQSRLAAVFQRWEINLPSDDSEKLSASTLWVITAWKAVIRSCRSSARTLFLFGVNRSRWIPERPDSPIWANADKTLAPLSLREAVKRPLLSPTLAAFHPAISYLFVLGFMNSQACKSEHMDVANGKVKTQPLSIFHAFTQVVHVDALSRFSTSCYCCWAQCWTWVRISPWTCPSLTFCRPDWGGIRDHFRLPCWNFLSWTKPLTSLMKVCISLQTSAGSSGRPPRLFHSRWEMFSLQRVLWGSLHAAGALQGTHFAVFWPTDQKKSYYFSSSLIDCGLRSAFTGCLFSCFAQHLRGSQMFVDRSLQDQLKTAITLKDTKFETETCLKSGIIIKINNRTSA